MKRKDIHRWEHSREHEHFSRTRKYRYQVLKKLTGKGPENWRTIRFRTYKQLKDMEWLETYEGEDHLDESRIESSYGGKVQVCEVNRIYNNDVCFNIDSNCSSTNNISATSCRVGIEFNNSLKPSAECENSLLAEMHSRSP